MTYNWYDLVGNIGIVFIVAAYLGVTTEKLSPKAALFHVMNGVGALLILVSLFYAFNLSSFIIEIVWLLISGYGLIRVAISKKKAAHS